MPTETPSTPMPVASPTAPAAATSTAATPTRTSLATATPGGGGVTLYAVAVVNVTGNDDPSCPACDGRYDDADRAAAAVSPLPSLTFVVRGTDGGEVGRQATVRIDRMQIAAFTLPAAGAGGYDLALEDEPAGWHGCPNAPLTRHVDAGDFVLGTAKVDFHFSNTCLPANRPPLEPVQIPGGAATATAPTAVTAGSTVLFPAILRGGIALGSNVMGHRSPAGRLVSAVATGPAVVPLLATAPRPARPVAPAGRR